MKNILVLVAFMAAATASTVGQAHKSSRADEEIRRLNVQEVDALLRNDITTLKRLWSDSFVVTNPFNKFLDKQQVVGMTETGALAFKSYDRQVDYVRIYGITAIVAGSETVVWAGKLPTTGQTSHLRFTGVWMKQHGRWREVARHANMVMQP